MGWKKSIKWEKIVGVLLSPALVIGSGLVVPEGALGLDFNPPSGDVGRPASSIGGGTRGGSCTSNNPMGELRALMPLQNNIGRTTSQTPTMYWYVPKNTAKYGEFVVTDEQGNELYLEEELQVPAAGGLVKITIPASAQLEMGKEYKWQMSLVCDPEDRSTDEWDRGKLVTVSPDENLQKALAAAGSDTLKQAEAYAGAGIWQETLGVIIEMRQERQAEWTALVEKVLKPVMQQHLQRENEARLANQKLSPEELAQWLTQITEAIATSPVMELTAAN